MTARALFSLRSAVRSVRRTPVLRAAVLSLALGADAARIRQFRVEGVDPAVMLAAVSVVACVSFGAAMVPAYRASRIDPARTLRWE